MPAFIKNLTFDCVGTLRVARFWAAALGSDVDEDSNPKRAYVEAPGWGGPNIWFRGDPEGNEFYANRYSQRIPCSRLSTGSGGRVVVVVAQR